MENSIWYKRNYGENMESEKSPSIIDEDQIKINLITELLERHEKRIDYLTVCVHNTLIKIQELELKNGKK
jgi:hypothetical protein